MEVIFSTFGVLVLLSSELGIGAGEKLGGGTLGGAWVAFEGGTGCMAFEGGTGCMAFKEGTGVGGGTGGGAFLGPRSVTRTIVSDFSGASNTGGPLLLLFE